MSKDPQAVALGKRRWAGVSAEQRREYMAALRAKRKYTAAQRAEIGRRLTAARAAKRAKSV